MKLGSVFSGVGGLDLGVQIAFPEAELTWLSEIEPSACKVLDERFPGILNIGDIEKVDWSTVEPVDIIAGGSPCFPAGTLIDTEKGYVPIEDIRLGDRVKSHKGRYMPVIQLMQRHATDTLRVKVMGSPEFETTKEHPFYAREMYRWWDNSIRQYQRAWMEPEWVEAEHLTKNHFVGFQLDTPDPDIEPLGEPLAYLIGRWLGDGWVRNGKRSSSVPQGQRGSRVTSRWWQMFICCAPEESGDLEEAFRRAGLSPTKFEERTVTKFRLNSKSLVRMLLEFGQGASGKKIPGWVFRLPFEDQEAIWNGWADADGSQMDSGAVRVTTVSEELAHGMSRIARNVFKRGVSVHKFEMPPICEIEGRIVNQRDQLQVVLPRRNRQAFFEDGWVWVPVRLVEDLGQSRDVYNFGVLEDESYTAWGITVHNCQDLSNAGARQGMYEGTRSGLWFHMLEGIRELKPQYVIWENVRGALSARASSDVEWQQGLLDERPESEKPSRENDHTLRALGRVLGDLSEAGYDAAWTTFRGGSKNSSDWDHVGAPHQRERVFVLATYSPDNR